MFSAHLRCDSNSDAEPQLSTELRVQGLPTLVFFRGARMPLLISLVSGFHTGSRINGEVYDLESCAHAPASFFRGKYTR
eukprot:886903-Pleurochrysis_carterae.AAC.1